MSVMANDLNRFHSDVDSFARTAANLRKLYEDLASDFSVLKRMWEGEAFEALQKRFTEDHQSLEALVVDMEKASSNLKEAEQTYTSCEHDVSSRIDSLRI